MSESPPNPPFLLPDLEPLELSVFLTGRRFFRIAESAYIDLCEQLDTARGLPSSTGDTLRFLPLPADSLRADNDDILISLETWRITGDDEAAFQIAITTEDATELTHESFAALLPPAPPDPFA